MELEIEMEMDERRMQSNVIRFKFDVIPQASVLDKKAVKRIFYRLLYSVTPTGFWLERRCDQLDIVGDKSGRIRGSYRIIGPSSREPAGLPQHEPIKRPSRPLILPSGRNKRPRMISSNIIPNSSARHPSTMATL
jgi:hypothetical protein